MVRIFDNYNFTRSINSSGTDMLVSFQPTADGKPLVIDSVRITYNLAFLVALILAVPNVRLKPRIKILVLGIIILLMVQVIRVNIIVFYFYSLHMQNFGQPVYVEFVRYGLFYSYEVMRRLSGMLFPVIIWAGLYYYYCWYPQLRKKVSSNT
ncbi:MAG: hypothetical protein AB1746_16425 [Candidatus Zixiibacteriota bacterium]